jgi:outer membrane protein OmpA-like peptidoglycan-associated protein
MMLAGLAAAGCVPSRRPVQLPASVPVDHALSADIHYVFFGRGKAEVGGDGSAAIAAAVLEDARRRAKGGPVPRLTVIGYTDAGPTGAGANPAWAQRLSLRRAQAVAARLAGAGIPPGRIAVSAAGAADPLLPAPAGTPEPANDRVEIGFQPAIQPANPAMSRLDATPRRPI